MKSHNIHVLCKQKSNGLTRTYFRWFTETERITNFEYTTGCCIWPLPFLTKLLQTCTLVAWIGRSVHLPVYFAVAIANWSKKVNSKLGYYLILHLRKKKVNVDNSKLGYYLILNLRKKLKNKHKYAGWDWYSSACSIVDISTCIVSVRCRFRVITLLTIWLLFDIIEITQHTCTLY